jgi:hypothetical protein
MRHLENLMKQMQNEYFATCYLMLVYFEFRYSKYLLVLAHEMKLHLCVSLAQIFWAVVRQTLAREFLGYSVTVYLCCLVWALDSYAIV